MAGQLVELRLGRRSAFSPFVGAAKLIAHNRLKRPALPSALLPVYTTPVVPNRRQRPGILLLSAGGISVGG